LAEPEPLGNGRALLEKGGRGKGRSGAVEVINIGYRGTGKENGTSM